jgi:hypothetical protein
VLRIFVFAEFSFLFILLVGYLLLPSILFLMGDYPVDCKFSCKDHIVVILTKCSVLSLSL